MKINSTPHVRCTDKKGRVVMVPEHLTKTRAFKIQGLTLSPLPEARPQAIKAPVLREEPETVVDDPVESTDTDNEPRRSPGRPKGKKK